MRAGLVSNTLSNNLFAYYTQQYQPWLEDLSRAIMQLHAGGIIKKENFDILSFDPNINPNKAGSTQVWSASNSNSIFYNFQFYISKKF